MSKYWQISGLKADVAELGQILRLKMLGIHTSVIRISIVFLYNRRQFPVTYFIPTYLIPLWRIVGLHSDESKKAHIMAVPVLMEMFVCLPTYFYKAKIDMRSTFTHLYIVTSAPHLLHIFNFCTFLNYIIHISTRLLFAQHKIQTTQKADVIFYTELCQRLLSIVLVSTVLNNRYNTVPESSITFMLTLNTDATIR